MTDRPADTPRLTDADVRKIEQSLKLCQAYHTSCRHEVSPEDHARTLLAALREARALLAALKAEGCPARSDESGDQWCFWSAGYYSALQRAALAPDLFKQLWTAIPDASNDAIKRELVFKRGFLDDAAGAR